jgi:hypothetical protein
VVPGSCALAGSTVPDEATTMQLVDAITVLDSGRAMGDDGDRFAASQVTDRGHDVPLRPEVERVRRFVERWDGGVVVEGARDGDALDLSAREPGESRPLLAP